MRKGNWTNGMKKLRFLGFTFSLICVIMLIAYFCHFNSKFAVTSQEWANFGSYFGSITGLMAFLAVLFSAIQSEKRANKAERRTLLAEQEAKIAAELAKQESDKREAKATEQAVRRDERDIFFKLLELDRDLFNNIRFTDKSYSMNLGNVEKYYSGIEAFDKYKKSINHIVSNNNNTGMSEYDVLKFAGNSINNVYGQFLGQYIRNIHFMLETFENFDYNKDYYFNGYKAQLSRSEEIVIFIVALSDISSYKFVKLLKDYNILDRVYYKDLVLINGENYKGNEQIFINSMFSKYLEENKE